jgi:hypothetical protein
LIRKNCAVSNPYHRNHSTQSCRGARSPPSPSVALHSETPEAGRTKQGARAGTGPPERPLTPHHWSRKNNGSGTHSSCFHLLRQDPGPQGLPAFVLQTILGTITQALPGTMSPPPPCPVSLSHVSGPSLSSAPLRWPAVYSGVGCQHPLQGHRHLSQSFPLPWTGPADRQCLPHGLDSGTRQEWRPQGKPSSEGSWDQWINPLRSQAGNSRSFLYPAQGSH